MLSSDTGELHRCWKPVHNYECNTAWRIDVTSESKSSGILTGIARIVLHKASMARRIRLGVLVPSSNTALEPLTRAILSTIHDPDVMISLHFTRFAVTHIDLSENGLAQFNHVNILAAAQLLADAKVDVIGWSGTSGGWLGFDVDEKLCAAIHAQTGIPATTSTAALNGLLKLYHIKELGLITPYLATVNEAIMKNYAAIGVHIDKSRERHLDISDNHAIYDVGEATLDGMIDGVVTNGARAVTTFCTNLRAAQRVCYWEEKYDIIVFDTVATVIWDMLCIVGINPKKVQGWGRLFDRFEEAFN